MRWAFLVDSTKIIKTGSIRQIVEMTEIQIFSTDANSGVTSRTVGAESSGAERSRAEASGGERRRAEATGIRWSPPESSGVLRKSADVLRNPVEFSGIRWSSPDSHGDPLNPLEIRWIRSQEIRWIQGLADRGQLVFFRRKKWAVNAKMCRNANQNTTSFNRNQAKRVKKHPNYGKCKQNKAHQESKFSEIAHSPIICQSLLDSAGPAQPPPPTAHCHPPLPR